MAILSSDDLCSSISSSSFMKEISKMNENLPSNEKIIASKVYFSTTVFNVTEIEFALEFINIMQPKVILLLSPISAHDVVLKVSLDFFLVVRRYFYQKKYLLSIAAKHLSPVHGLSLL